MNLLQTQHMVVDIPDRSGIEALDLTIRPGQCWGVLGPNGAGKSTLLHTLAGLRPPRAGTIKLENKPLAHWRRREIARRIAVLFQDSESSFPATVRQVALTGRHPWLGLWEPEGAGDHARVDQALALMDLSKLDQRMTDTLSGGEHQRLALATVLVQEPALYLLDEPANHLDLHHQVRVLQQIRWQVDQRQRAAVMALHDINMAARWCDRILLMFGDGSFRLGSAEECLQPEPLSRLYDHPVRLLQDGTHRLFIPQ